MSENEQEPQVVNDADAERINDAARQIRLSAIVALGLLATTTLQVHNENMAEWFVEEPDMTQAYNPLTRECLISYTIKRILENGQIKRRKFNAIYENDVLVNTSVDFCVTEIPVEPTAVQS